MQFPRLLVVRQKFPDRKIADVAGTVRAQLAASNFTSRLKPGARVAIGVGSRGIHNIATIVYNVVQFWKEQGMQPLLFPAVTSHGGEDKRQAALRFPVLDDGAGDGGDISDAAAADSQRYARPGFQSGTELRGVELAPHLARDIANPAIRKFLTNRK